jgi:hypothetical protein
LLVVSSSLIQSPEIIQEVSETVAAQNCFFVARR